MYVRPSNGLITATNWTNNGVGVTLGFYGGAEAGAAIGSSIGAGLVVQELLVL